MWRSALILVIAMQTASADPPPKPPACDAAALEKTGDEARMQGLVTIALDKYDQSLRCESTEGRVFKAGLTACELYQRDRSETSAKRAKRYYDLLHDKKHKDQLAQACTPRCRLEY